MPDADVPVSDGGEVRTGQHELHGCRWPVGPARPWPPRNGEVHVWCAPLDPRDLDWRALGSLLDESEQQQAARIRSERDRRRYSVCHGTLRQLLGGYLGSDPRTIRFVYGPFGKPVLERKTGPPLHFNLSHCEGLALYAFSAGAEVGIDIERVRRMESLNAIAEFAFSPAEYAALRRVPASRRTHAFFRCWTRKEAFVKANGASLTPTAQDFDVTMGRRAALLRTRPDPREARSWSLRELEPVAGWVATLALRRQSSGIKRWRVADDRFVQRSED